MPSTLYRLAFNAGEITPELSWRNDLAKFQNGCRTLSNFLVTPYGAVRRRPATAVLRPVSGLDKTFVGTGWSTSCPVRLFQMTGTNRDRFVVLVGAWAVPATYDEETGEQLTAATVEPRLYVVNDAVAPAVDVTAGGGHVFALDNSEGHVCPWPVESLDLIQAVQVNDVMIFAHPAVHPKRLEHRDTGWTFKDQEVFGGPFLDGEEDGRTVSLSFWNANGDAADTAIANWSSGTTYAANQYAFYAASGRTRLFKSLQGSNLNKNPASQEEWWDEVEGLDGVNGYAKLTFSGDVFTGDLASWAGTPWAVFLNSSAGAVTVNWTTAPTDGAASPTGTNASAGAVTKAIYASGTVSLVTSGVWGGEIALEESTDGGSTWMELGCIVSNPNSPANGSIEREVTARTSMVRVRLKSRTCAVREYMGQPEKTALINSSKDGTAYNGLPPWDTGCAITLKRIGEVWIYGTIVSAESARVARFVPAMPISETVTASPRWSEGLFSTRNGFPRALTIFQERLVFGGNYRRPQSVWASSINDWGDFRLGTLDTAAFAFTLAADRMNAIRWLRSGKVLFIGTDSGEWQLDAMNKQEALTAGNVQVSKATEYGSAEIQACPMSDVMVFVQRNGKRLRSMVYDYNVDGFVAPDLSMLGKHLLAAGVAQLAFQRHPDPILWLVLGDGGLVSFTYDRDNDVLGWARHSITGSGGSPCKVLAVTSQPGESDDEVWFLVLDAAGAVTLVALRSVVDGQGREQHLDMATWDADGDGGTGCWVGNGFVSLLEPTGMAAPDGQHGKRSRISGVRLFLHETAGGQVSADGGATWEQIMVHEHDEEFGQVPAVTGQNKVLANSGWGDSVSVMVRSVSHHPLTVCALGVEVERGEA